MVSIEWWYARTGPEQVGEIVSYSVPVNARLKAEATRIAANARVILNTEPKTRTGDSQVGIEHHDLDWYVTITDKGMAASIIDQQLGVLRRSV
ncbi:hypothetical protein ABZX73_16925 [Brevibacterium casei]|uniref:hypothetical protein n=1 Tax=Brevibacterium sanguinis TaxID=232444 RepID=UPI0031D5086C